MKHLALFVFYAITAFQNYSFAEDNFFEDIQFYNFKSASINEHLNHADSEKRATAVRLLSQTMQPAAYEILLSRNWSNENFNVKSEICFAVGQIGLSKNLFDPFLTQATQTVNNLLTQSLDEKSKLNCIIASSRIEKTEMYEERLISSLAMITDEDLAADYLVTLVYHIRAQSIQNPNQSILYSEKLFKFIKKYSTSSLEKVRRNVAIALGRFNFPDSKSLVLQLLDDPNTEVQLAALNSLKRLGAADHTEILLGKLSSENFYIQYRALSLLAQLKKLSIIPASVQNFLTEKGHFSVAQLIIQNLESNSPENLSLIDSALNQSNSSELKSAALQKLNKLSPERLQSLLPTLLNSAEPSILEALTAISLENKDFATLLQLIQKQDPRSLALLTESLDKLEINTNFIDTASALLIETAANENLNFVLPVLLKISDSNLKSEYLFKFLNKIPSKPAYDYIKEEILANLKDLYLNNTINKDFLTKFLIELLQKEKSDLIYNKILDFLKSLNIPNLPNFKTLKAQRSPFRTLTFDINPIVVLNTSKGKIFIELYANAAPVHVANFVGLVQTGYYNNNYWHRVVSDFVIQSGSLGETGYWDENKFELLSEITPFGHERGSLGMARSDKFDSGSNQIFIDHQFTPGLDGLYTVFGKVTEGMNVVDRIERGDKIISAEVIDSSYSLNN
jgi:cyclophilin family peptidyl-prolyl cis-trans isomerase